jgi:hypothetical protein
MTEAELPDQIQDQFQEGDPPSGHDAAGLGRSSTRQIAELRTLLTECEERALKVERYLDAKLDEAERRIAFLEEEPQLPTSGPIAPSWVQSRLHRALARAYHVFEALERLPDRIERYEDALLMAQSTLDDLAAFSEMEASVLGRLEMLPRAEEVLQEIVESSVDIESLQDLAVAASEVREEIELALQQTEHSPLRLGSRMH